MQSSLVSIGQLCDARCIATFDKHHVFIKKGDKLILQGQRDPATGLWTANLGNAPVTPNVVQHVAMSAIATKTIGDHIAFLHACAGSPALSTPRTSPNHAQLTARLKSQPTVISPNPAPRCFRFQLNTPRTTRKASPHPRTTRQARHMVTSCSTWILHRSRLRALPLLQSMGPRDQQQMHCQHFTLVPNPSPVTT